jgi:hypothetical protein
MKLVRGSEINDFLRCRLRWQYAWVEGYRSKKQNGKLFIGTLIHKYLETWYSVGTRGASLESMLKLYEETDTATMDPLELNEMWKMAMDVTDHYSRFYRELDRMKVVATELTFAVPLDDEIVYTGTIDLIYEDEDGNIRFMDHKSTDSITKYEKNAIMDRQISRYWWALQQLMKGEGYILQKYISQIDGKEKEQWVPVRIHTIWSKLGYGQKEVAGFTYNILLKTVPHPPKVLAKGGLSKDKSQNTTFDLYLKAIEENGLNRDDYDDFLKHLAENGKRYFSRISVNRLQPEIDSAIWEFYTTTLDSLRVRATLNAPANVISSVYRNITEDCHWDCAFKDVCTAGMDGSNVNYLLNIAFNKEEVNNGFDIQKTN